MAASAAAVMLKPFIEPEPATPSVEHYRALEPEPSSGGDISITKAYAFFQVLNAGDAERSSMDVTDYIYDFFCKRDFAEINEVYVAVAAFMAQTGFPLVYFPHMKDAPGYHIATSKDFFTEWIGRFKNIDYTAYCMVCRNLIDPLLENVLRLVLQVLELKRKNNGDGDDSEIIKRLQSELMVINPSFFGDSMSAVVSENGAYDSTVARRFGRSQTNMLSVAGSLLRALKQSLKQPPSVEDGVTDHDSAPSNETLTTFTADTNDTGSPPPSTPSPIERKALKEFFGSQQ